MKKPSFWTVRSGCSPTTCLVEAIPVGENPTTFCGRGGKIGGPVRRHSSRPDCERCLEEAARRVRAYEALAQELVGV